MLLSYRPFNQSVKVVIYLCNLVMQSQWMESAELCINLGPISDSVFDSIHVMTLSSSSCFITGAIPAIALDLLKFLRFDVLGEKECWAQFAVEVT